MKDNSMSEEELIAQANGDLDPNPKVETLLDACEAFYLNGFADEVDGDVDSGYGEHFYRVHRWIVSTNDAGFQKVTEYDNEDEAHEDFLVRVKEYESFLEE